MEEHDVAVPFLHPYGGVEQPFEFSGERGEFVKMGREQGARAIDLMQVLDRRPGNRQPVEGCGPAPDLVEDDKGALAGLIEDRGGLHHLHHEGRAPAGKIVGGPDPREQAVDDADARLLRRHEAPHLGEHRDQRVLAQVSRLARHVGAGDEIDAPCPLSTLPRPSS